MKKILIIFIIMIGLTCVMVGCANHSDIKNSTEKSYNNEETSMYQLNERQIKICEEAGLPTNYDELTPSQQSSIERIEELLQYLDKTYNTTFFYKGYSNGGVLEGEWLEAYSAITSELYPMRLEVDKNGNMSDNYYEVLAEILLGDDSQTYLNQHLDNQFKVFVSDCRMKNRKESGNMDDLNANVSAEFTVFVKGKSHKNDLEQYAQELVKWFKLHDIYGRSNFIMVSDEYFKTLNVGNYGHAKLEDNTEISLSCDMSEDGIINIY